MSEVRGRAGRTPCLKGSKQPRGVIPRPRSGAAAKSTRLRRRRNGREELSCVRGQGRRREELPHVGGQGRQPEGDTPRPKPKARGGKWEELPRAPKPEARGSGREELPHAPMPEARDSGWEDQPQVQGAIAARVQEGLEEISHVAGQEGRR